MAILPHTIYIFNTITIKIPVTFCTDTEKLLLKCIWKYKRPQKAKEVLDKKSNAGGITIPDFKMVLTQKQTGGPMGLNRRSKHKPMHL
jgi:hypothetical protein